MKRFSLFTSALMYGALTLGGAGGGMLQAAPETEAAAGRELAKRYADAVVNVELVVTLKIKFGEREAQPREQRVEVNGTVISPEGLTVTSLATVDPQATLEANRGAGGRTEIVGSEFKEVKLRTADGKEVPARFVLKDADLDLAFMMPEPSETPRVFPYVKLTDAAESKLLSNAFYVSRAPKILQRVPLVRATEIMGVLEKPRRFYITPEQGSQWTGAPIFDAQGKVLGVTLQHFANGNRSGLVILPAEDIAEMAKQAVAPAAKASEAARE